MSDPVNAAAEAAIAGFWSEQGREEAAVKEVPDVPVGTGTRTNTDEYAQQQSSLVEDGSIDPEQPDGVPVPKTETKPQATGKPATSEVPGETPATDPSLDPVLRAIAEEAGWDAEKIDKLYGLDPELATEVFGKLADQYADMSRQFLTAPGSQPATVTQTPAQVPVQPQGNASALPKALTDEDLAKIALDSGEQYANALRQMRDHQSAQVSALESRVKAFEAEANEAKTRAVAMEANTVLGDLRKQFPKLYGTTDDPKALTLAEHQKTVELVSLADQLRAGAVAQGRTLSVGEAIKRSHYIVSRDSVKAEARKEIASTLKNRVKSANARPTQRQNPKVVPGETKSDAAAMEAFAQKAAEIGLNETE